MGMFEEEKKKLLSEVLEEPKDPRLAKAISITSPQKFRESIKRLGSGGYTLTEIKALSAAKGAARLQLGRKRLSPKERKEFEKITKIKLPKVTK